MSERTLWILIFAVIFVLMIGATGFGLWQGNLHGRAEMKRWQDEYFAAHPVVKEVPEPTVTLTAPDLKLRPGWTYRDMCIDEDRKIISGCMDGKLSVGQKLMPQPNKARKPLHDESYFKGYEDASAYCLARLKKLHAEFNEYRALVESKLLSKQEPAPLVGPGEQKCFVGNSDSHAVEVPCWKGGGGAFIITIPPDESAQKAKCEKEGGFWDHMDGTSCYATNPQICSSHCDPNNKPAAQP